MNNVSVSYRRQGGNQTNRKTKRVIEGLYPANIRVLYVNRTFWLNSSNSTSNLYRYALYIVHIMLWVLRCYMLLYGFFLYTDAYVFLDFVIESFGYRTTRA